MISKAKEYNYVQRLRTQLELLQNEREVFTLRSPIHGYVHGYGVRGTGTGPMYPCGQILFTFM